MLCFRYNIPYSNLNYVHAMRRIRLWHVLSIVFGLRLHGVPSSKNSSLHSFTQTPRSASMLIWSAVLPSPHQVFILVTQHSRSPNPSLGCERSSYISFASLKMFSWYPSIYFSICADVPSLCMVLTFYCSMVSVCLGVARDLIGRWASLRLSPHVVLVPQGGRSCFARNTSFFNV